MRPLAALLALAPALAGAQPISFSLKNDVPAGQKPSLTVTAVERVLDVRLELARPDGGRVEQKAAALDPGRSVTFPIGDGASGKTHWHGAIKLVVSGEGPWSYDLDFDTLVRGELKVNYQRDHLDLDKHVLEIQLSRPAGGATLTVLGDDGSEIGEGEAKWHGEPAGTWVRIPWRQSPGNVMKMELHVTSADGLGAKVVLAPWTVQIPHEEVNFENGSAEILASERPKLDAAYARIMEAARKAAPFVKVLLFIAGHTDTVGTRESNYRLSVDRARAIAGYFKQKGIKLPISYEGFGESILKVKTPDETPEPQNRRVDYVLAAEEPPVRGAQWKSVQ